MKVAVVVGVVVPHDAISSAATEQVVALQALPEVDEVCVFTQGMECEPQSPTFLLGDPWELLRHPEFRRSDVAIFHWGIHFALFDAITLLGGPGLPLPVVHFHNCTPASLVEEHHRENIFRSIHQLHHVVAMRTPLWTYSEFNRRTLIDWGAAEAQISWVTFPIRTPTAPTRPRLGETVHLLSVGRLVPAKGVHVLIDALAILPTDLLGRLRLRVVSSRTFSSSEYGERIEVQIAGGSPQLAEAVELIVSPSHDELRAIYQDTDVVISPSFHEGLCVPVIEGYAAGCRAIGTTAGNLPYVVVAPDPVVAPGDPVALADAITNVVAECIVDDLTYKRRCRDLVDAFGPSRSSELLARGLRNVRALSSS